MQRILITPTFRPHFAFNREFLQSYERYAEDAHDVAVHFIVTRDELDEFSSLMAEFPSLDLHAHAFEDLLAAAGHHDAPLDLLREVGKFTYQSLKKLLALKYLSHDQALVLDSEALVVKPVRFGDLFDAYYADPFILYSDLDNRGEHWFAGLSHAVVRNAATLLRQTYPKMYFLEYYGWFYEKRLIDALFDAFPEGLLTAIRARLGTNLHVFECQLIYGFVLANRSRFPYRFVSVNTMLREYLGDDEYAEYMKHFQGWSEQSGVFEWVARTITERNLPALERLFNDKRFAFYRFELLNLNADLQQQLIDRTPIAILASSEGYRRSRERIAVCLSGEARNPRQNLRFLRSFLAENNVDVFFHLWDSPDAEYIRRVLEPVAYAFAPKESAPPPPAFKRMEKAVQPTRAANSTAMFHGIKCANDLKRAYEEAHGFRYDVVVRLRLDFFTTRPLLDIIEQIRNSQKGWDRIVYVPDMAQSVGLNDQIALGSSETMDVYAGTYDSLPYVAEHDYFNPEYVLLRHLQRSGLRIRTFSFEYVILREQSASTFDLEELIRQTRVTWWSAQLPDIKPGTLDAYFAAKADSVSLIDELNLETPRLYRLRAGGRGYVRFDATSRRLEMTPDASAASEFYVIIPADGDRTAVNIRPRDLVLSRDESANGAGAHSYNFYPANDGAIRADGPGDEESDFFIGRSERGLVFEWRPGFWKTTADARARLPRPLGGWHRSYSDELTSDARRILQPSAAGLALVPITDDAVGFSLEYVPNPAAEAVEMGLDVSSVAVMSSSSEKLPVRLLYLSYLAARLVSRGGAGAVKLAATDYLRRQAHLAERSNAPGLKNAIKRRIGRRL